MAKKAANTKSRASKTPKQTPLMQQYAKIKSKHPDAILLFRVGDFYETFESDAVTTAKVLNITLTKRANGSASAIELAGFPHHSLDNYLPKLVRAGYRVAVCDQLENPKMAKTIVKRGITELVTPGVAMHDNVLEGNTSKVIKEMKAEMHNLASVQQYEKAQQIKEKLQILGRYQSKSTVVSPTVKNADIFNITSDMHYGFVNYTKVVNGAIIKSFTEEIKKIMDEPDSRLLEYGIINILQKADSNCKELIVPFKVDLPLSNTKIIIPKKGDKHRLLEMALRNAKYYKIDKYKIIQIKDPEKHTKRILEQLKTDLKLKELPTQIECFDNSNFQGDHAVAAMVCFKDAKPSKKDYRHYTIRSVTGPDDFASMQEVVYRRYKRLLNENKPLPQLIVIDGGKGQLSAALKSVESLNLKGKIAIIGIAKKLEEIYFPNDSLPLFIDKKSESLKIIQQLRNEAHRFGIAHYRKKHAKSLIHSELESIKGIGKTIAHKLLVHFKSAKNVRNASFNELSKQVGPAKAGLIAAFYEKNSD